MIPTISFTTTIVVIVEMWTRVSTIDIYSYLYSHNAWCGWPFKVVFCNFNEALTPTLKENINLRCVMQPGTVLL